VASPHGCSGTAGRWRRFLSSLDEAQSALCEYGHSVLCRGRCYLIPHAHAVPTSGSAVEQLADCSAIAEYDPYRISTLRALPQLPRVSRCLLRARRALHVGRSASDSPPTDFCGRQATCRTHSCRRVVCASTVYSASIRMPLPAAHRAKVVGVAISNILGHCLPVDRHRHASAYVHSHLSSDGKSPLSKCH
jgi:hypothetical protein